jgi:sterol 3beta-glucosyltransferase
LPPGPLSYFFHWLTTQIFWHGGNVGFRRLRKTDPETFDLVLRWPFNRDGNRLATPLLLACSSTVIPRPHDWSAPHIHIPGYFFLELSDSYQPPVTLNNFMSAGEPPVCVSFGSMIHHEAERIYRVVFDSMRKTGNRAVILSGWDSLSVQQSENVLVMDDIPHDWLLPRCKAVVHHGGAGTTAAGLHSGIPNIVVPFAADQPFWGARVHAIGAGPQPIPVKRLTVHNLSAALVDVKDDAIRNGAQVASRKIRAENGVGVAIKTIEEYTARRRKNHVF